MSSDPQTVAPRRYLSRLTRGTLAVVMASGRGERLKHLKHIFTQTEASAEMLRDKGFNNVSHAGDTRVDRVLEIVQSPKDFSWLKHCLNDAPVLVAGSTWPEDEARLIPAIQSLKISCIIAAKYTELAIRTLHEGLGLDKSTVVEQ